jgi:ABC-type bacteriocin/lantibiotic exporter with double-glycine peptidase domain
MIKTVNFFFIRFAIIDYRKGDNNMLIDGIKIVKQKQNNTCGYVTACMLLNYFQESNIDEDYLLENDPFDERGITFFKLLEIYKKYLKGYDASLIREDKEGTLKIIKQSLSENIPLHVLHLTENLLGNKEPVLHYAVLIGYDEEKDVFTLADPYGFNKTIGKDDFFDAISFRNDCLPEFIKKAMPSNAMIRFSECT